MKQRKRLQNINSVAHDYLLECKAKGHTHTLEECQKLAADYFMLLDMTAAAELEIEKDFEIIGLYLLSNGDQTAQTLPELYEQHRAELLEKQIDMENILLHLQTTDGRGDQNERKTK